MKIMEKLGLKKALSLPNAPWLKNYGDIPKHIKYDDISLFGEVNKIALKYPNYIAYTYYGTTVTYKKFVKDIEICARAFKALGIKKEDIVTICMPNTPEALIAFYGLNMLGAIANMIHPLSSEEEIKMYVNNANCKTIIVIDMLGDKINSILHETNLETVIFASVSESMNVFTTLGYFFTKGRKINRHKKEFRSLSWNEFISNARHCKEKIIDKNKSQQKAVILYSGGTTGKPKGIVLSNLNFNALAFSDLAVCKDLAPRVSILSVMPIFHGFGLGCTIHACFCAGGKSILLPSFSAKKFDSLLTKYRPNIIAGVPTVYEALINSKKLENMDLSYLKCCISGGDSLSANLKKKVDEFLLKHYSKAKVRPAYGLTECTAGVCMTPIHMEKEGSVGIPCPDSYVKIVKPSTHEEVPYMEDGEICIMGPTVMMEYLNEPQETADVLQVHDDGYTWLHTGDLGCLDEDGFVYFKQRLKRMIVSSGYNIYPQYIENIIESHPAVLTCTVIGIDHPYKVQVAKAFIVLKDGIEETNVLKRSIKDHCKKHIASYSMPYEFEYRQSLPKTLVGKVAFNVLIEEEKNKKKNNEE